MTQKELNYIEDIINHERLIVCALENNNIEDKDTSKLLSKQIDVHNNLIDNLMNILGGKN
jgi:hypothetical protein